MKIKYKANDDKFIINKRLIGITSSMTGEDRLLITKDYDDVLLFKELNELAQYIAHSKHDIFELNKDFKIIIHTKNYKNNIFKKLIDDLHLCFIGSLFIDSGIKVNAWLDILIRANKKLENGYFFRDCRLNKNDSVQSELLRVRGLNRFIDWIRRMAKTRVFKVIDRNLRRKEGKNERGIHHYFNALWQRYSDLNIVRVDLEYKKNNPCWHSLGTGNDVSVDMALEHRELFIKRLERHPMLGKKLGYIIKLEYGLIRGFHFHVLLIFNGQVVQNDIAYGKVACELWKEITEGRGEGWNCNLHKASYARTGCLGIGRIRHFDHALRHCLEHEVLDYFTKLDTLRKVVSGSRALVKSLTPPPKAFASGRPRRRILVYATKQMV